MKKPLKTEAKKEVEEFFRDIGNKKPGEIKRIKKLAMRHSIALKEKRKLFCGKCYSAYRIPKIRIKGKVKSVVCENCGSVGRWRL